MPCSLEVSFLNIPLGLYSLEPPKQRKALGESFTVLLVLLQLRLTGLLVATSEHGPFRGLLGQGRARGS
jgi:hypothetical protein